MNSPFLIGKVGKSTNSMAIFQVANCWCLLVLLPFTVSQGRTRRRKSLTHWTHQRYSVASWAGNLPGDIAGAGWIPIGKLAFQVR